MASNYDTTNAYDTINAYDTGGGIVIVANTDVGWQAVLNQLAGTSGLGENAAANMPWASAPVTTGTTNLGLLAALNHKAGTKYDDINLVCNAIAGTNGLEALQALNLLAGHSDPG